MITFTKLIAHNFMALEYVEYEFTADTLRLLLGENLDSVAADDNGAGKSSLAEALRWGLYGETVRQTIDKSLMVEHVIREGQRHAQVEIGLTDKVVSYWITRTRTKTTQKLELMIGTVPPKVRVGKEAQEEIEHLLGINVMQFSNLVHLDGSYPLLFAPSTDRNRKNILADLVDVAITDKMQDEVKDRLWPLDEENSRLERAIERDKVRITDAQTTLVEARKAGKEYARQMKVVDAQWLKALAAQTELEDEENYLAQKVGVIDQSLKQERIVKQKEIDELGNWIEQIKQSWTSTRLEKQHDPKILACKENIDSLTTEIHQFENRIADIEELREDGVCPTCGQDTTEVNEEKLTEYCRRVEELQHVRTRESDALEVLEEDWETRLTDFVTEREAKEKERERCHQELADLLSPSPEYVQLNKELKEVRGDLNDQKLEIAKYKEARNTASSLMKREKDAFLSADATIKKLTTAVEAAEARRAELAILIDKLDFWRTGFGPKGVPSLFIETVLPRISARIQHYADILTGGDVTVGLKAYRETKSKTVQEAIQIEAINSKGASVYGSNSTGERNRINLAVTLGLIDYFRSVNVFESNLLICDEIFDGLDATGVEMSLQALAEAKIPHVIVVSHHEHLKPMFPAVMYARKQNGAATLEV